MHKIVVSSATSTVLDAAREWLAANSSQGAAILATSRGTAHDFALEFCRGLPGRLGLHTTTPIAMAVEMATAALAQSSRNVVTSAGAEALAARAVHRCRQQDALVYFEPVADTPGFARALHTTLTELRLQEVEPADLENAGPPGRDLAELLLAYENQLRDGNLADLATLLRAAIEHANRSVTRFRGLPSLWLSLSPQSRLEGRFLRALAEDGRDVFATALAGDTEGIAQLESILTAKAEPLQVPTNGGSRLRRLRERLFADQPPRDEPSQPDATMEFFSEPGEGRECVEIVRKIRFAVDEGYRFDQIAILLRSPRTYLPLVEDALQRAGVPACFSRGTVRPDPGGRAFLALLECASEGLSASRFAEYLSLGQVPFPDDEGKPPAPEVPWVTPKDEQLTFKTVLAEPEPAPVDAPPDLDSDPVVAGTLRTPARWEQLLVDAAVIGGRDRWERRLNGLKQEFEIKLRRLEDDDEATRENLTLQLRRLGNLQNFALPLIEALDALPEEAVWSEWLQKLEALATRALRDPDTTLSLLAELRAMAEIGPVGLEEVKQVLGQRLTFLRKEPAKSRYGSVFVATIPEVAGRAFDLVFLPGLAEGIFPRKALEDPLLLDVWRRRLNVQSALDQRRIKERLLLRQAVAAARRRLVVSYPRMDVAQGRSRVPSFYALDVLRAADGRLPDVRKLEKTAAEASDSRLGWPAPSDPSQAIDEAEYDLALLDPLLRSSDGGNRGRARFLLDGNPHLERSLRTRWLRWSKKFTPADGVFDPDPATLRTLATQRLRQRSYSPTALQQFAVCPYKFLLYSIHRLRLRDEAVAIEQMDPLTRGGLFHEVQFKFFKRLRELEMLPITPKNSARALEILDEALDAEAKDKEDKLAPAIPGIWNSEIEEIAADLRGWLRQVEQSDEAWVPARFELAFGLPDFGEERDSESVQEEVVVLDGVRLRGSIDLVEKNSRDDTLRVIDHKTGKAPAESLLIVKGGEILQPLLYSLAAEKLLGQRVESGQLFYCTQRGEYKRIEVPLTGDNTATCKTVLEIIDTAVRDGTLPAAPRDNACDFCDFRVVCGPYEERRTRRKRRDPLVRLDQLRELR